MQLFVRTRECPVSRHMPRVYTFTSNKAVDTDGQANSTLPPRRSKRHRKLSGHEKRRYLTNVTECNIFRASPIFDKTNFQQTRELRPNYVRYRSSYERRCEFKISHLYLWQTGIIKNMPLRHGANDKGILTDTCVIRISFMCKRENSFLNFNIIITNFTNYIRTSPFSVSLSLAHI